MIDKYENQPDSLHSMCLTDIASSYVAKKAGDVQIEPEEIENFTVPVSNMDDVEPNPNLTVVKNELGKIQKRSYSFSNFQTEKTS